MEVSALLIRLIVLALPGIIAFLIYSKLIRKKTRKDWEDILRIVAFSMLSYFILFVGIQFRNYFANTKYIFITYDSLFNESIAIPALEVFLSILISIFLAFIFAFHSERKTINKLGVFFNGTKQISQDDVWEDFLESASGRWVFVRDEVRQLIYLGYAKYYSESEKNRELVLGDVEVYDNTYEMENDKQSHFLYELDKIYISRNVDQLTIELPKEEKANDGKGTN